MKQARHSLALSLISLVLCITMLLGSTWAWFTDSVTSTNNRISTGILDIELEYYNNGSWDKVTETTNIFREDTLWEPGHAEVVYFKISNLGSLALKYNFGVNVVSETLGINVSGDAFKLSDHIRYGVDLGKQPEYSGGQEAISAVSANSTPLNLRYSTQSTMNEGAPEAYLALVVYMPETVGNVANAKVGTAAPKINLGITLAATQNTVEADSFGPDYDAGAFFPDNNVDVMLSAPVVTDTENKSVDEVTIGSDDNVSAFVPAGALVEAGATSLTLKVSELETTNSNITVSDGEEARSVDIHVDGIAEGNTVPVIVTVKELMPKGLNMGNYTLYHVEDTTPVVMTYVTGTPVNHNEFSYDPVTGDVVVAMKSFSEVAASAQTDKAWEGNVATDFAGGEGTEENPYIIANADQLAYFARQVGREVSEDVYEDYAGKYIKLASDINLGDKNNANETLTFYPIGYQNSLGVYMDKDADKAEYSGKPLTSSVYSFDGIFDGNGHTISNIYQNTWDMLGDYNDGYSGKPNHYKDGMGLFGYVHKGTVKNLTVDNFSSDGEFTPTGVIAAFACDSTFENIAITNSNPRVYNTGNGGIVGIGGNDSDPDTYKLTFKNITIDNTNKITALWGSWDVACGGLVGMFRGAGHAYMTNCHVAAQIDVFNDVCGNYQYYWYRYSGMMIGTNKNMITDDKGYTVPETDKYHAEKCTVHFGDWNDYYYCELVANSLASYTHDHQFSRLEQIQSVSEIQDGQGNWTRTGNFIVMNGKTPTDTCYHIVKDSEGNLVEHTHESADYETVNGETVLKENNQRIYLPFNQLFTGYGWGVKHIPVYNGEDYAFDGITILDREIADSQVKFEAKDITTITADTEITIGELFGAIDGMSINTSGVLVSAEAVDPNNTVKGKFVANADDWTKSTISINGVGSVKLTIQDYDYCTPTTLIVTVNGPEAPTNASIVSGKLIDIDTAKNYEVAKITLPQTELETEATIGEYSDYVPGALDSGLWNVRVKANGYTPASDAVTLWSRGANVGSVAFALENDQWDSVAPDIDNGPGRWYFIKTTTEGVGETKNYQFQYTPSAANKRFGFTISANQREELLTNVLTYPMTPEEYIPVQGFKGWATAQISINAAANKRSIATDPETIEGRYIIHVYDNGAIKKYEVSTGAWSLIGGIKSKLACNFADVIPADATGYIYRIDLDLANENILTSSQITFNPTSYDSTYIYFPSLNSDSTRIPYQHAKKLAPATTLDYEGSVSSYVITGFDSNRIYRYSTDGVTFNDMKPYLGNFVVTEPGTYYFYSVEDTTYFASDMVSIEVKELPDAPTGLSVIAGNKVAGLENGVSYEYAQLNAPLAKTASMFTAGEYAPLTADTELTGGLWAVRYAATENANASKYTVLYVVGSNVGSLTWNIANQNPKPIEGTWSAINTTIVGDEYYKASDFTNFNIQMGDYSQGSGFSTTTEIFQKEEYATMILAYTMTNEEIIPAKDFIGWPAVDGKVARIHNLISAVVSSPETISGKITVYVYGGEQESYEKSFTYPSALANTIVDWGFGNIIPDTETGYVWRIDVDWFDEEKTPYSSLVIDKTNYTTTRWMFNGYYSSAANRLAYSNSRTVAPEIVLGYKGTGTNGVYAITGLDSALTYQISSDGINYVDVPAGRTTATVNGAGTYYVFSCENDAYYQSKAYSIVVEEFADAPVEVYLNSDNTLAGLEDGVAYEYAQLTVPLTETPDVLGLGEFAPAANGIELTSGLWAVRYSATTENDTPSKITTLYVAGENVGSIAYSIYNTMWTNDPKPRQGTWTVINSIVPDGEYYKAEDFANSNIQTSLYDPYGFHITSTKLQKEELLTGSLTYLMTNDEIVPANDFLGWNNNNKYVYISTINIEYADYTYFATAPEIITGKMVVYVHGGKQSTYEASFTHKTAGGLTQMPLNFANIIPEDETGYIWRIDFDFADEAVTPYSSITIDDSTNSVLRLSFNGIISPVYDEAGKIDQVKSRMNYNRRSDIVE